MMEILKFFATAFIASDLLVHSPPPLSSPAKKSFDDPHFVKGHGGIVQLFEWKWSDVAAECENFLSPHGYGGVQISPPNENAIIAGRPWYERYQPISYKIMTRSGNEEEFLDMTKRCNAVGVRIYADVVFNHMAADQVNIIAVGTGNSTAVPGTRDYPAVPYNFSNFHPTCTLVDYNDKYQVRNCELVGLHDLNQTVEDTRNKIVGFLNHLIDLGVAGFRVDAAKHQWPQDLEIIYNRVNYLNTSFGFAPKSTPFIFQEVIDSGYEAVSKYEYIFAIVDEFRYSSEISRCFRGEDDLKWLSGFGEKWALLPSNLAMVFVDNHDSQRNGGVLTYKNRKNYLMAQVFSLAHPYGHKRVMSSFAFETSEQGPPCDENEEILSPTFDSDGNCVDGWVCEHRWNGISQMIGFMNLVQGENVTSWWDNGKNQIAFSRGSKGFVVFNLDKSDIKNVTIQTGLPTGIYCDLISGHKVSEKNCSGKVLEVDKDGKAIVNLRSDDENGVMAMHVGQKLFNKIDNSRYFYRTSS